MGWGTYRPRSADISSPFKGEAGMGHVFARSADLTFPFKGEAGRGMGQAVPGHLPREQKPSDLAVDFRALRHEFLRLLFHALG